MINLLQGSKLFIAMNNVKDRFENDIKGKINKIIVKFQLQLEKIRFILSIGDIK